MLKASPAAQTLLMLMFYYHPSPDAAKVALFSEEGVFAYELMPAGRCTGEQFSAAFVASNPKAKTPAVFDGDVAANTGESLPRQFIAGDNAWGKLPHLKRLFDEVSARPAAVPANALKDRHIFKTELDAAARRYMFPHNVTNAA